MLPMKGAQIQSLVRELRSIMQLGTIKKKKTLAIFSENVSKTVGRFGEKYSSSSKTKNYDTMQEFHFWVYKDKL